MTPARPVTERPRIRFKDRESWRRWLISNHAASPGIWLQFAKKASGIASVTYFEAVETALCFGWIDGQIRKLDADYYLQSFTPRTARSMWSKVNRAKALKLIAQKAMEPAGLAAIAQAKANGRWAAAYEAPSKASVPCELKSALADNPAAAKFFRTLDSRNRYAIIFRIQTAEKSATRVARARKFAAMLARNEKIYA